MTTPKKCTLSEQPYFFGNYLNMARHNAFQIIRFLTIKYKDKANKLSEVKLKEESLKDADLFTLLDDASKPDVLQSLIKDLIKYFPFLQYLYEEHIEPSQAAKQGNPILVPAVSQYEENFESSQAAKKPEHKSRVTPKELNPADVKMSLSNAFALLNPLRNSFTHHYHKKDFYAGGSIPEFPLIKIYKAAVKKVQPRFKEWMEEKHLERLQPIEGTAATSTFIPQPIKIVLENGFRKDDEITDNTLAFFVCLFLEPKYAYAFLPRLTDFQVNDNPYDRTALKTYSLFCCRLPQPKLESVDITLDMANELKRCPQELYDLLSKEDKNSFISKIQTDSEADSGQTTIMKRHKGRFHWFILRYLDDSNALPTLRFQLQLGKAMKKPVYEKEIYGVDRERKLERRMRTFGKLKAFSDLYNEVNQDNKDQKTVSQSYADKFPSDWKEETETNSGQWKLRNEIVQFSLKYNISENSIGFKFISSARDGVFPAFEQKGERPDAILSMYELQNLFLYDFLYKKLSENNKDGGLVKTEGLIRNYIKTMRAFFKDVKSGAFPTDSFKNIRILKRRKEGLNQVLQKNYGISINNIPVDLRDFLLGVAPAQSFSKKAEKKVAGALVEVNDRLEKIEKNKAPKTGQMATWLAEDIVQLMPHRLYETEGVEHLQKLNNLQYRVLQSSLAYFSSEKSNLKAYFEEVGLTGGDAEFQHPFLKDVGLDKCFQALSFYQQYLIRKQQWLIKAADFVKLYEDNPEAIDFEYGAKLKMKYKKTDVINRRKNKKYDDLPILLPRGLFKEAIKQFLKILKPELAPLEKITSAFALDQLNNGDAQIFYKYDKFYKMPRDKSDPEAPEHTQEGEAYLKSLEAEKGLLDKRKEKSKYKKLKKPDQIRIQDIKRRKNDILESEEAIRFRLAEDHAMWLLIKEKFRLTSSIDFQTIKLAGLRPIENKELHGEEKDLLNEPVEMKFVRSGVTIVETLPIRRYGDFQRIFNDGRLNELLKYKKHLNNGLDTVMSLEEIKKEMEAYDRRREAFFKSVYEFEKAVYDYFPLSFPSTASNNFFNHHIYMDAALAHLPISETDKEHYKNKALQLRNKFLHNQLPGEDREIFDWLIYEIENENEVNCLIVDRIFNIAERNYQALIRQIEGKIFSREMTAV